MEEQDLRGDAPGLHQARLGPPKVLRVTNERPGDERGPGPREESQVGRRGPRLRGQLRGVPGAAEQEPRGGQWEREAGQPQCQRPQDTPELCRRGHQSQPLLHQQEEKQAPHGAGPQLQLRGQQAREAGAHQLQKHPHHAPGEAGGHLPGSGLLLSCADRLPPPELQQEVQAH